MMDRKEVLAAVKVMIESCDGYVSGSCLEEDANLRNDLCLDSLDILDIAFKLEKRFNIEVDEYDFGQVETVGGLVDYVMSKL